MIDHGSAFPNLYIIRHGATAWSTEGRHTGRSDIPLLKEGEEQAQEAGIWLRELLQGTAIKAVYCSPLLRAKETALRAGFRHPILLDAAQEWDYGSYEGKTSKEIHELVPDWSIWKNGPQGGETIHDVAARGRDVISTLLEGPLPAVLFAHGHFLRIMTTQWIGTTPEHAEHLALDPAAIGLLGIDRGARAIQLWNSSYRASYARSPHPAP